MASVSTSRIIACVADEFGLMHGELKNGRRERCVVNARFLAQWLCKQLTPHTLTAIGGDFGGRDHTTVLNGIDRADYMLRHDGTYRRRCMNVLNRIEGRQWTV